MNPLMMMKVENQLAATDATANIGWYVASEKWHHFWELLVSNDREVGYILYVIKITFIALAVLY